MKLKQTFLAISGVLAVLGAILLVPTATSAVSSCGGVETSIIKCDQTGPCSDSTDPYEGMNPGTDKKKQEEYQKQYGHAYAKCKDGSNPNDAVNNSGIWGVLLLILNIMTTGVGVLAVAGVVYGSVLYASAGDSAEQVKKAKGIILNVVIGLIAFGLMYALLNFLIPGGIFT
jgi:hypothetical protein